MEGGPVYSEENERQAAAILQQIADLGATVFFEKPLTASDASGSGRVVIPKVCLLAGSEGLSGVFAWRVVVPMQSWSKTGTQDRTPRVQAIAEQYFPRLEQPSGLPVRAVDTRAHEYTFKFR